MSILEFYFSCYFQVDDQRSHKFILQSHNNNKIEANKNILHQNIDYMHYKNKFYGINCHGQFGHLTGRGLPCYSVHK